MAQPLHQRGYREIRSVNDGLGQADRLVRAVGVAAADRRDASTLPKQPLPDAQREFVVEVPPTIPHLKGVHVRKSKLPGRSGQRHGGMSSDHYATARADFAGEAREGAVAWPVSSVDPAVRWQAT